MLQPFKIVVLDGDTPESTWLWDLQLPESIEQAKQHAILRTRTWMTSTRYRHWSTPQPEFVVEPSARAVSVSSEQAVDIVGVVIDATGIDSIRVRQKRRDDFQKLCRVLSLTEAADYRRLGFLTLIAGPVNLEQEIHSLAGDLEDDARHMLFGGGPNADMLLKVEGVTNAVEFQTYIADFSGAIVRRVGLKPRPAAA